MPKEVLIYGHINAYSVMDMLNAMMEVESEGSMNLRINTDGGQPQDGIGIVAKFQEFSGEKNIKVDGRAYSTGLFLLLFANDVTALNVSKFMVHRVGYSDYYEQNYMTAEQKQDLISINKDYEKAFRNKIDVNAFESGTGVKIKDIFNVENVRKDVYFDSSFAKKIGLVKKVVTLSRDAMAKIDADMNNISAQIAAKHDGNNVDIKFIRNCEINANDDKNKNSQIKNHNMNKKELLAAHPEICAELIADGVAKEKARVDAWMANSHIDLDAVKAGIDGGKDLSQKEMVEFSHKLQAHIVKGATSDDINANKNVDTDKNNNNDKGAGDGGTTEPTALEKVEAAIDQHLKLN